MTAPTTALLREYHRRLTHFDVRSADLEPLPGAQLQGELIGIRGALGIALGGKVPGGEADRLASEQYELWRVSGEAPSAACNCVLCRGGNPA